MNMHTTGDWPLLLLKKEHRGFECLYILGLKKVGGAFASYRQFLLLSSEVEISCVCIQVINTMIYTNFFVVPIFSI